MLRHWFMRGALLAIVAILLTLGLAPVASSQAAPPLALTASAEPPTRTPVTATPATPTPATPTPAPAPNQTATASTDPPAEGGPLIDLSISKSASPGSAAPGARVTFTLTVRCLGQGQAENVEIVDTLPDGLALIEATTSWGELTSSGRTVRVSIPVLYAGDEVTIQIVAQVEPGAGETLVNVARVTTDSPEQILTNNEAAAPLSVLQATMTPPPPLSASPAPEPLATLMPVSLPDTGMARRTPIAWLPLTLLGIILAAAGQIVAQRWRK